MDTVTLLKIAAAAVAGLLLGWRFLAMYQKEHVGRAHMLDGFLDEIAAARLSKSPWRTPRVEGLFEGAAIRVDLVPDTLVQRALPTLWLELTWARPHEGHLYVTIDPVGTEYMIEDEICAGAILQTPPTWPKQTRVCGDGKSYPILDRLASVDPTDYPHLKQLAVTEQYLKLTLRATRAEFTTYRFLRSANFPADAVTPELIRESLSLLRTAERTVTEPEEEAT